MARESTQHKLDRVRSPRVHITYDVETGGAIELKELPFVVGVLGDFTGQPVEPLPKLKERKFVEVNPDNFDTVLEGMKPHLAFSVENKLSDEPDAPNLKVDLNFKFDDTVAYQGKDWSQRQPGQREHDGARDPRGAPCVGLRGTALSRSRRRTPYH